MCRKKQTFLWSVLLLPALLQAQSVKKQNSYFQQEVNNIIRVTLDDESHLLRGDIRISYTNNSRDTLSFIFFHLWPNAYSDDKTAYNRQAVENKSTDFYLSSKLDWGYIDSLDFTVDGESSKLVPTEHKDVVKLLLNTPVIPGETIEIHTPFYIQIPRTFSRFGHHGQSYQITQWFPKPAVYDEEGWHPMPYLDQGEFYSEFGSYDVSITVPKNYIVMATGNLQTPSEVEFLDSLSLVDITVEKTETPPSHPEMKTIRYTEDNIHDFAWFADKRWSVRKGKIKMPFLKLEVEAWSAFFPEHYEGWKNSIDYLSEGIKGYSKEIGAYPFKTVKAVEGPLIAGGGMEYPTITIIIPSDDPKTVETIIVHEVGHNWFYGILGSNERRYPWLDESINSYYENKILLGSSSQMNLIEKLPFLYSSNAYLSQPLNSPSESFTHLNYGADVYQRGAIAFEWLNAYIGEDAFTRSMKDIFDTYKFRHLSPKNFEQAFVHNSDRDVSWFFNDYMASRKPIDFRIQKVKHKGDSVFVTVRNRTHVKSPAILDVEWRNTEAEIVRYRYLSEPFTHEYTIGLSLKDHSIRTIGISETIPDVQKHNNYYTKRRINRFRLTPIATLNLNEYKKISIAPAIGYNRNNGFMLGALFHNITMPAHRFQFALAPLYGFRSKSFNGTGFLNYTQYTPDNSWLHNIDFNLSGKSFGMYNSELNVSDPVTNRYIKISPEITFNLRKSYDRSPVDRQIIAKGYYIQEQELDFQKNPSDSLYRPSLGRYEQNTYFTLSYHHWNRRTFNPYGFSFESQYHSDFIKLSLEGRIKIDYHYKKSGLNVRVFAGKMIPFDQSSYDHYRYRFAGTFTENNDYLYDHTIIARGHNTGFGSQQIHMRDAGMKIQTLMYARPLGMSDNFTGSLNLTSDIPIKGFPVKIFADIMTFSNAKKLNASGSAFLWDAGLEVDLWGVGSVYIPLAYSKDYRDYINSVYPKSRFFRTITFTINFNQIKWYKPLETIPLFRSFL